MMLYRDYHVVDKSGSINGRIVSKNQRATEPEDEYNQYGAQKLTHGMSKSLTDGDTACCITIFIAAFIESADHFSSA